MWRETARAEQLPPEGDWRVWYVRGGRGCGKTRTGAETLAGWILDHPVTVDPESGRESATEWAVVAPTFGDARDVCIESSRSGLLRALGPAVTNWNRSIGEVFIRNGAKVYIDGADDGALRVQGKNLSGAWCDEVGLWQPRWDQSWNISMAFAVRFAPSRIIATGTPRMGHGLVKQLMDDPFVAKTHMPTADNAANLDTAALADLQRRYSGTRYGRQELEGEFLTDVEGDILKREWWQPYPLDWIEGVWYGPPPDGLISSWDTALKEKTTSDYTVGTLWVTAGPNRYLVRRFRDHVNLPDTVLAVREQVAWAQQHFTNLPCQVLIENTANGPEIIGRLRGSIQGVLPVTPSSDKATRAHAASVVLESGNVYVPAVKRGDGSFDLSTSDTPAWVAELIDECALFKGDRSDAYDDQVDSVTQALLRPTGGRAPRLRALDEERKPEPALTGWLREAVF